MSMCRTWIIWFLLACSLTTTASATTSALSPELDNYIESTMKEFNIPGLALAVINERGVMWSKGFGYRDVENQLPIDGDTLFAIGSTTKAMTAAGIGILVDQGLLEFDKPLVNYLTDFQLFDPITTSLITPRDLLGHTSGLPRHDLLWYGAPWSREELYSRLRYLEPSAGFRQKFQYQNLMYMTAGVLIERVTGESWESFTRKEILQPLGMTRTTLNLTETQIDPNYSKAYSGGRGRPAVSIPMRDISAVGPAGSVHSSVEEMAQWLRLQLQKGEWEG
ncbi:MAG: beta-lactamase family protein, partial [Bdellovibrionales bacterium]|nr:beta-lactamase family protein [Bdellovibrionales bacterium]